MTSLNRQSLRIVLLDDDPNFLRLALLFLQRAGFTQPLVHFSDALVGLPYLLAADGASLPHVVLLDVNMPGASGFVVLAKIRELYDERELAVFLLTASFCTEEEQRSQIARATRYLDKLRPLTALAQDIDELIDEHNVKAAHMETSRVTHIDQYSELPRR